MCLNGRRFRPGACYDRRMTERTYTADEVRDIVANELQNVATALTLAHHANDYARPDFAEGLKDASDILRGRAERRRASTWVIP